jgi:transcriptional regulator of acetoin/glycerol metabolism
LIRCYITSLYKAEKSLCKHVTERILRVLASQATTNTAEYGAADDSAASSASYGRKASTINPPVHGDSSKEDAFKTLSARRADAASSSRSSGDVSGGGGGDGNSSSPVLNSQQVKAVQMAKHTLIMLLTGDAGCGKTSTTRAIVEEWIRGNKRVAVCAPTGVI